MRAKSAIYSPTRLVLVFVFLAILYATYRSLTTAEDGRIKSQPLDVRPPTPNGATGSDSKPPILPPISDAQTSSPSPSEQVSPNKAVWQQLRDLLREARPKNSKVRLSYKLDFFDGVVVPQDVDEVPDVVNMTMQEMVQMTQAHSHFVSKIKEDKVQLQYTPGSTGVVMTSSDSDLGSVVMAVRMLRRTGCTLPVEVFVSTDKVVSSAICADVLNGLNAKCIATTPSIGTDNPELDNNRFLNKLFALLFSSFDNNLLLDADNLPVLDPTSYLENEPYASRGLVAWPDFWPSSISKKHANITSTTSPPVNGTIESGQLLLSKDLHAHTLLLAFYYNFYGPDYYYPLESQGAVGGGDKETFITAALALHLPFYLVSEELSALGFFDQSDNKGAFKGEFRGLAMAQFDLAQDYRNTLNEVGPGDEGYIQPKIMFVHHNMLKPVPDKIFTTYASSTKTKSGKYTRLWGSKEDTQKKFDGVDVEKVMWETLKDVTCDLKQRGLLGKKNKSDGCDKCKEYMKAVFGPEEQN